MKKFLNIAKVLFAAALLAAPVGLTSCNDDDEFDTNQYVGGVNLNAFGPSPVARGGELRFLGSGMDQITKITIPGCGDVTDIKVVSPNEIRITVPQTAEEGKLVLTHAGGTITTKTLLTYLEPVSIESLSPMTVKPGQTLAINGEYLNLMKEVIFSFTEGADSANVYVEDFAKHERGVIEVVVPENAISGPIAVSDAQELPNVLWSEMELTVVLPSVEAPLDLTNAVPGSTVTIKGNDLDLVKAVEMPNGDQVDYTYNAEAGTIAFTLPANVTDGAVVVIPASGVRVAVANIGVVVPTELVAEPATGLRPGQTLKIKGLNMDQVTDLTFTNVEGGVTPTAQSATELTVEWPASAQSGAVTLNLHSGKSVTIDVATAKPEVTGYNPNPINAGGAFTFVGKNLDLIATIAYNDGTTHEVANANPAECVDTCPASATTGVVTLTMANGEKVDVENVEISSPVSAFITSTVTEEVKAGDLLVVTIGNADVLTNVLVDGQPVQFINNAGVLYISIPASTGKKAVITLVSSNGQIAYDYDVIPATHVENVILNGPFDLSWSGDEGVNKFRLYKEMFDGVPVGANLVFHVVPGENAQIQFNDANWGQIVMLEVPQSETTAVVELTAEVMNRLLTTEDGWSTTAAVIQGQNCLVSKVVVEWENSLEETIWQGPWDCLGWSGNQDLAWGGFDWTTVKPGQILTFYMTPLVPEGTWWCISLRHGNGWGALAGVPSQYDSPADGIVAVELTQEIIDDLNANGGLVITGQDYTLNKITIL